MMRILVTGACGFIGSHLVQALHEKIYKVRALVRRPLKSSVEIIVGNMQDAHSLDIATKNIDAVIHLAASTSEKQSSSKESYLTNVQGAKNLVESCKRNKVKRIIIVSTQSTKRAKQGNYGRTKSLADDIFMNSGLDWTIVKPTLVYGPGSKGLFSKILKLVQELPLIPVVGSGRYKLQPTYVGDVVAALISILDNPKTIHKVYDLAGKDRLEFMQMLHQINAVLQQRKAFVKVPFWLCYGGIKAISVVTKNPPVTTDNLLGLIQETSIDLEPATKDFNYQPISFKEGMYKAIWGDVQEPHKKNVGIIGLGKMGVLHASIVNYLPNAQIVALFDVNQKVKKYVYSLNIKAPFFTDIDQFLSSAPMDAVFISVPPAFTHSIIKKCAARNIHIFVEKPLATDLSKAQSIVQEVHQHRLYAAVGYMYGYKAIAAKAKQILDAEVLGKLDWFEGSAYVTQVLAAKSGWRYQKSTAGGGCVSLHGTHLLYLLYYLLGSPLALRSKLSFPYSAVEDKAEIEMHYTSRLQGELKVSWSEPGYPSLTIGLAIRGEFGSLEINESHLVLNLSKARSGFEKGRTVIRQSDLPSAEFELGGEGYYAQDKNFIDALWSKAKIKVKVDDALLVQKMLQAVYNSHQQGKDVKI